MEATNDEQLKEIQRKIMLARAWAYNHFNFESCNDTRIVDEKTLNLLPPSFFVEFPSPDTMIVNPSFMGRKMEVSFRYRLHFRKNGSVYWQGHHPISGSLLPPLEVSISPERMRNVIIEEQVLIRKVERNAERQEEIDEAHRSQGPNFLQVDNSEIENVVEAMNKQHAAFHDFLYDPNDYKGSN